MRNDLLLGASLALAVAAPPTVAHDWNGLVLDPRGDLLLVDAEWGEVLRVTPAGAVGTFVARERGAALGHPHHLSIDGRGALWLASG